MIRVDGDRAVGALALAVVVSIGVVALPMARQLRGDEGSGSGGGGDTVAAAVPVPPVDLAPLRHFAPFGTRPGAGTVPGDASTLGLQVRGILLARPAAASIALIAAADGPAKGYAVGATLPGGAVLDAVEFDLVVLRVNGRLLTLALPRRGAGMIARDGPSPPAAAAALPAAAAPIEAHLAQAQAHESLTLLGSLGAVAGPGGYRVGGALPDDMRRAGLQPGDTIEKVDGVAIGNAEHDRALFDNAVVAGRMRVEVIRGGKPVALSIPLH